MKVKISVKKADGTNTVIEGNGGEAVGKWKEEELYPLIEFKEHEWLDDEPIVPRPEVDPAQLQEDMDSFTIEQSSLPNEERATVYNDNLADQLYAEQKRIIVNMVDSPLSPEYNRTSLSDPMDYDEVAEFFEEEYDHSDVVEVPVEIAEI